MDTFTLVNIFDFYGSILSMFPENEKRKNCFLAACNIWDEKINLEEFNQKFPHGGLFGYGNLFLDFFFARLKVFRLHSILPDSAGAVKVTTNKGPGYCYMLPNFPSSCFLGHLIGLIFCVFIKFHHPKNARLLIIFVIIQTRKKCLSLCLILSAWKGKLSRSWVCSRMELYWDTVSSHPKTINLLFKQSRTLKIYMGLIGKKENWNTLSCHQSFNNIVHLQLNTLQKGNLLSNYLCKDMENLDDLGCPKVSKFFNNSDTDWDCSNYPY